MDFTHPIAITRVDLPASIVPLSPLFLLRARLLRPFFLFVVALLPSSPTRGAECQFSVLNPTDGRRATGVARIKKKIIKREGEVEDKKRRRISLACYLNAVGGAQRLPSRIAENRTIEFKSASPLGKMIRSALIR